MALKASQVKVGDKHSERVVENLSRTQIVMYAGASGDYNPIHSDEVYTREVAGYPSVTLTVGLDEGRPVALVLNGLAFSEATLLRLARVLERATGFDARPPL